MAKGKVELSVEDLIATIKNSNLPNVIVEGSDDIVIFRRLEEKLASSFVSVLPVGGRDKVIELHRRRSEFSSGKCVAFVADRDTWIFSGVPAEHRSSCIVFTDGYSIENDAIRDGHFFPLMTTAEDTAFKGELATICKWFALAARRFMDGYPEPLRSHPAELLAIRNFDQEATQMLKGEQDSQVIYNQISLNPYKLLRGKTLLALIMRQLSYRGRVANHQPLSLLDVAGAKPGQLINDLFDRIKGVLKLP